MNYLADTVALVRHLRGGKKLGTRARKLLQEADVGFHTIYISGVTLMEILYLSESRRIPIDLNVVQGLLTQSRNYRVIPVGLEVVALAAGIDDVPELHDRLIVATAKLLTVPILTNDPVMSGSKHTTTIWK
jgi:predicted nucleic acid-binding protein